MKDYEPKKAVKILIVPNMNNLYGWTMSEYLPYEWLRNYEI